MLWKLSNVLVYIYVYMKYVIRRDNQGEGMGRI